MYFGKFPRFLAKLGTEQKVLTDFFVRVGVGPQFAKIAAMLMPHTLKSGDRPETVAHDVYGSATYHWVILLLNNIVDVRNEWPLSDEDLARKIVDVYPNPYGIHHHELAFSGSEITPEAVPYFTVTDLVAVTNAEFEIRENEAKRQIKLLDPKYLAQFVRNFENEVSG